MTIQRSLVIALATAWVLAPPAARAGVYPVNTCVSAKMTAAGKYCSAVLKAWSTWDKTQDATKRDDRLGKAVTKLGDKWSKAELQSSNKSVNCADTTLSSAALRSLVDAAAGQIVTEINTGLDLGTKSDATCGAALLKAAAKKCLAMLKAEAKHIKKLDKDPAGTLRDAALTKASDKFGIAWDKQTAKGCPTAATEAGIEALVDTLKSDVVTDTTVSPNVDDTQFTTITPALEIRYEKKTLRPACKDNSTYRFFVKRGSVNKLLMYYQGGGACWEQLTCGIPVCDTTVDPAGSDNPNNGSSGFADLTNPNNPFKDWNVVAVSYCSCDVHFGDAAQDYDNTDPLNPVHVEHRGFHNAKAAEKWAREHFVNPEMVFVTGSSAGSYGALFHAPLLQEVWPASTFRVLGDAGNGVITPSFLQDEFENWNFRANLPPTIPGVVESIDTGTGMVGYIEAVAAYFPGTNWAHYTTAFDGGSGGQTGFYNVMLNGSDPLAGLVWWQGSCAFNAQMRQQAFDTYTAVSAAHDNYRYYIGTGSRHTGWGANKVYTDTTGGVPILVDWITAMLDSGPGWVNVEASPFNVLLPGDPQPPSLPTPPFEQNGLDIVVNCP